MMRKGFEIGVVPLVSLLRKGFVHRVSIRICQAMLSVSCVCVIVVARCMRCLRDWFGPIPTSVQFYCTFSAKAVPNVDWFGPIPTTVPVFGTFFAKTMPNMCFFPQLVCSLSETEQYYQLFNMGAGRLCSACGREGHTVQTCRAYGAALIRQLLKRQKVCEGVVSILMALLLMAPAYPQTMMAPILMIQFLLPS